MVNTIIQSFDIWTDAQGLKSKGRVKSVDNISLEGIARLRELILELAVMGKLVPQNPKEEPAIELLERISKEKTVLTIRNKNKKISNFQEINGDDKAFNLPESWEWTTLSFITTEQNQGVNTTTEKVKYCDAGFPVIQAGNISNGYVQFGNEKYVDLETFNRLPIKFKPQTNDILYSNIGANFGVAAIVPHTEDFIISWNVLRLKLSNHICLGYIRHWLNSPIIRNYAFSQVGTSTVPFISGKKIELYKLSLPPLAEQKRIVAKVDELMALCDKLEEEQSRHLKTHQTLVKTLLETLTLAKDSGELQAAWQRMEANFDTLFCTEDSIDQLKQTILQLAVMGKLVKPEAEDEPASELLKKIADEKEKLVKEGKIKKGKPLAEISDDEKPFGLPIRWEWINFGEINQFINGDRGKNYPNKSEYLDKGIAWINTGHIEPSGTLTTTDMNYISKEKFDSLRSGKIQKGDLVYCLRGATFGKTAFVEPYNEGAIASSLMIIRPHLIEINKFIYIYLISPLAKQQLYRFDNGSAQPNLSANSVQKYAFPLPPLAEQQRIIRKVEQLFALCDTLKEKLIKAQELKGLLAKGVVEGAVG